MICSLRFKKDVLILKMLLWILCFWFWSYTLSKLLFLFFLCNFCSFFSYVTGVLVTNLFTLLLIDRYILAIHQIITHKEHLGYSFWSVAIFWTTSEALTPWSLQQKVPKTTSKSFSLSNSLKKSPFFSVLMYAMYDHPRYFKFKRKHQK